MTKKQAKETGSKSLTIELGDAPEVKKEDDTVLAWAIWKVDGGALVRVRLRLPIDVVERYAEDVGAPNIPAVTIGMTENEIRTTQFRGQF